MSELKAFVNGEIVPLDAAIIKPTDRGFLYGDGIFETLRAYRGRPLMLPEHLNRMKSSASILGIPLPSDLAGCRKIISDLIEANSCPEAYIRITVSRGTGAWGLLPADGLVPTLNIIVRPFAGYPGRLFENGAVLKIASWRRSSSDPLAAHKTTSYLPLLLARMECAREPVADEALILSTDSAITECSTANFFICAHDRIITPPVSDRLLPGVTRAVVMTIARRCGMDCEETSLTINSTEKWDECFITNSLMEIMPVRKIMAGPGTVWEKPAPGLLTARLRKEYRDLIETESSAI
ncbi:MAG TPA: aminotransferase class IV [Candidatus Brocadiia bacterium]|nr:aminotransferase class IV [Candidatus Brocadiia bacterium]